MTQRDEIEGYGTGDRQRFQRLLASSRCRIVMEPPPGWCFIFPSVAELAMDWEFPFAVAPREWRTILAGRVGLWPLCYVSPETLHSMLPALRALGACTTDPDES